ncbi:MAG: hypothetical protein WKF64_08475, partial [Ilumatobacteraceae bacterium]
LIPAGVVTMDAGATGPQRPRTPDPRSMKIMAKPKALAPFEDTEVASVGIKLAGAATGLADSMKVDPVAYKRGSRLNLLLVVEVDKVTHEPHDRADEDDDRLRRVHILKTETATFLADDVVADALQRHRDALKQLDGQTSLNDDDGWDDDPE